MPATDKSVLLVIITTVFGFIVTAFLQPLPITALLLRINAIVFTANTLTMFMVSEIAIKWLVPDGYYKRIAGVMLLINGIVLLAVSSIAIRNPYTTAGFLLAAQIATPVYAYVTIAYLLKRHQRKAAVVSH
jgi:hypothetical protein